MIKQPDFLKTNDKVGIVSPAGKFNEKKLEIAVQTLKSWGLKVVKGKNLLSAYNQFAGSDEERLEDFQNMINDNEIKAIICSRGGYGSVRIIEKINFSNLAKNPKWIVGFSDITYFHAYVNNICKLKTIHSAMPGNFPIKENKSTLTLKKALFGEIKEYKLPDNKLNINGITEGVLIGGNLSIIQNIIGSKFDYDTSEKILFIEDLGEYLYRIDRMMMHLEISGKLKKLKGLIVGQFTKIKDNNTPFGMSAYEIIYEKIKKYNIPVSFGIMCGHSKINQALILGNTVRLEVMENNSALKFLTDEGV